jgi:aspartyl-tRNA(Asn)/glutamyl-tRNA(Gln) amidotransferase subunit B
MAFDPNTGRTRVLRLKENSDDYRYFPDPDLFPLVLESEQIEDLRRSLPELADEKTERFQRDYDLSASDASALTESRSLAEFFEAAAGAHGSPKVVANWILRDVLRALGERDLEIEQSRLNPGALAALIALVDQGKTTAKSARGLVPDLVESGGDPADLVRSRNLEAVSDYGTLERVVDEVLAERGADVERYRAGEQKVLNFLMGQVMKRTQGKADPAAIRTILIARIEAAT